jgi:hypothetical protein
MPYDWSNVPPLSPPLQTTGNDVIFSGHGALPSSTATTTVPAGVEMWFLSPPGASIADPTGQALESMTKITKLGLLNQGSTVLVPSPPTRYAAGQQVPDYTLYPPNGIVLKPGGPHLLGVTEATRLSALWPRLAPFLKPGQTLRCFWAACTAIDGAKNQVILFQ